MTEQTRILEIDYTRAKDEDRSAPCTLTTEFPVERQGYTEVIELASPDNVDLSRAPLPLIESHDSQKLNIGLVDNIKVKNHKLVGRVVLGTSARAKEVWADIKNGIVRSVSIGYQILEHYWNDETMVITKHMPYELSAVSVAADPNAGFYRAKENTMKEETMSRSERRNENKAQESEQTRCNLILSTGRKHDCLDEAQEAIEDGTSYADFQQRVLRIIGERHVETRVKDHSYIQRNAGNREYSLVNAILGLVDPNHDNGFEREWGEEVANRTGKRTKPGAIYLPFDMPMTRALDYSTEGADLVGTDHLGGQFIDVLRNAMVVAQAGATILPGLQGNVSIPRKTASSTAYWVDGDGTALTESTPTFDSVTLAPHLVGGWVTATHRMLVQGDPAIEQMLRQDLADTIAVAIDLACLYGSGTGSVPEGIVNTTGINAKTFAAAAPTYSEVVEMETLVAADNAAQGSLAYIGDASMRGGLKTTARDSGSGLFVWDNNNVNGYPMYTTEQATAGDLIFGNFRDLLIGMWGGIELEADKYTNFTSGSVRIRALADVDCVTRHATSFCLGNDGA